MIDASLVVCALPVLEEISFENRTRECAILSAIRYSYLLHAFPVSRALEEPALFLLIVFFLVAMYLCVPNRRTIVEFVPPPKKNLPYS